MRIPTPLSEALSELGLRILATRPAALSGSRDIDAAMLATTIHPSALIDLLRVSIHAEDGTPVLLGRELDLTAHREAALEAPTPSSILTLGSRIARTLAEGVPVADVVEQVATLAASGLDDATVSFSMDEDAERARVSRPALYHHEAGDVLASPIVLDANAPDGDDAFAVALLPHHQAWSAPAYFAFGGWSNNPSPAEHVGVLRRWQQRWGAELIGLGANTMDLLVRVKPTTWRQGFELAQEHIDYCPGVLSANGITNLRELAHHLMTSPCWRFRW